MLRRSLGLAVSQILSLAMVTPTAGSTAVVRPSSKVANFEPEADGIQASVQQRLQNHERRIGQLEKITSRPVGSPSSTAAAPPKGASHPPASKTPTGTHTVRAGESPAAIARQYGVSVASLMKANRLTAGTSIRPGQRLQIPGASRPTGRTASSSPPSASPAPTRSSSPSGSGRYGHATSPAPTDVRYTVKPGDTVHSLAARHGISEKELCRRNGLSAADKLRAGTTLKLPALATAHREASTAAADERATSEASESLPDGWHWHGVERGESLSQIAARYGTDRRSIERVNNLVGGSTALREGMRLKIPPAEVASSDPPPTAKPMAPKRWQESDETVLAYVVQKGDTIEDLADQFKTSPAALRRLNRLGTEEKLASGRRIVVPNTLFE